MRGVRVGSSLAPNAYHYYEYEAAASDDREEHVLSYPSQPYSLVDPIPNPADPTPLFSFPSKKPILLRIGQIPSLE